METDITKFAIDFTPIIQDLLGAIGIIIGTGVIFLLKKAGSYIGLNIDSKNREVVQQTIQYGLDYAFKKLDSKGLTKIETQNQIVGLTTSYLLARIPDTLKHFNLTKDDIAQLVIARLGILEEEAEVEKEEENALVEAVS